MPNKSQFISYIASACLLIGLVGCMVDSSETQGNRLSPADFENMLFSNEAVQLVDCRTPEEFEGGYIEGAENIDFRSSSFKKEAFQLDKSRPILFYCGSGKRSQGAMEILKDKGYTVYDLKGGMKAWAAEGRKIVK